MASQTRFGHPTLTLTDSATEMMDPTSASSDPRCRLGGTAHPAGQTAAGLRSVRQPVYATSVASKTERLNLRLTPAQDCVLRSAAEARGESASEYVLRNAVEAAEMDLADRRVFVVDDASWIELQAVLSAPASISPPMAKLLRSRTVLE
jgi:uncharacterized protein (DUF1778 family)